MKYVFFNIEFILIFWAITYIARININSKYILTYCLMIICPTTLFYIFLGQWKAILFFIISTFIYYIFKSVSWLMAIHICLILIIGILTDNITQYLMGFISIKFLSTIITQYSIFSILFVISIFLYNFLIKKVILVFTRNKMLIR